MEKFFEIFLFAYSFQNKLFFLNNIVFCKIGGGTPRRPLRTAYEYISVQFPVAVIATLYYNSLTF